MVRKITDTLLQRSGVEIISKYFMESENPPSKPAPEKVINKRLQRTQAQVNEVVDIMRVNIEKVLERDKNLSQLDDRADALQAGASQFEASAGKLKRKFWWRNCKLLIVLCGVIGLVAIALIVALTSSERHAENGTGNLTMGTTNQTFESALIRGSKSRPMHPTMSRGKEQLPPWTPSAGPLSLNVTNFRQLPTSLSESSVPAD
ncbi:hypothetical protein AAHC03_012931 [Spirometra sp. Aus1]